MDVKDFRNVLLYMCNRWSKEESALIYNTDENGCKCDWPFSLGEHIWMKWINFCEKHHGSLDCIASFFLDLDNNSLQKLIDRSIEYYHK